MESGGGGDAEESAGVETAADGKLVVKVGSQNNGQGHQTAYSQLVAERLGLDDLGLITVVQGDTDTVPMGNGTGGPRAGPVGGAAGVAPARRLFQEGKGPPPPHPQTASPALK